jgi:recombination protein RecA
MTKEEKSKNLEELKSKINKDFGKSTIMSISEKAETDIDAVSTGSLGLDIALGIGGLPRGRVVEIYGPESSGKTTVAIHTMVEAHKKNPDSRCLIVDAEHAFDKEYASALGVDMDRLDISQPDNGDEALEIADRCISSGVYDVVIIDSVAALVPRAELEGEMGENKMGLHARLMSQALRKMTGSISKTNTLCIFINQLRDKIGVMYGDPSTPTGGNALKFYASVRLSITRSTTKDNSVIKDDVVEGNLTKVKVIKNKVAPPFRTCEFNIMYGEGIDRVEEIVRIGSEIGLFKKWGKTVTYGETKYEFDTFVQMLKDNLEFKSELENLIKEQFKKNK